MKISSIQSYKPVQKLALKQNNKQNNSYQTQPASAYNLNSYPIYNISFMSEKNSNPTFKISDDKTVTFSDYTTEVFLKDDEGNIDYDLVKKFGELASEKYEYYDNYLNRLRARFVTLSKKEEFPQKSANSTPQDEVEDIYAEVLARNPNKSESEQLELFIAQLHGKTKMEAIQDIIESIQDRKDNLPETVCDMTQRVFELSQTPEGYDFSDIDKKYDLVFDIVRTNRHMGLLDDDDISFREFFETSKDENGNIDYYSAKNAAKMMMTTNLISSPEFAINTLKHFYSKDPKNREYITSIMDELNTVIFMLNEENTHFQDLMELCFDKDDSFNPIKGEVLALSNKILYSWVADKTAQYYKLGIDNETVMNTQNTMAAMAADIIKQYFAQAKDDNGNFNPNSLNLRTFINEKLNKIR